MPEVAFGTFTTPAGTGVTQVISGLSFQPKALLVWGVRVTGETVDVDTEIYRGMTDGTGQTAMAISSATASANTQRYLNESATLMIVDITDTDTVVATFSAWETDGVSLNFSVAASGYVVHYIAMGGDDASYEHFAEVANTSPVSGLGFQPDGLVAMCLGLGAGGADSIHAIFAPFGVVDDAGNEWWLASFHGADANTDKDSEIRTSGFIGQMYIGAITWEITHTAWTSDGFTYGGTTNVDAFYGIAMNTGAKFKVGTFTKPTGTAPQAVDLPDLGINPTGYLLASGSEINEAGTTPRNARVSIGVTDGVLEQNIFTTGENSANNQDQRQDNDAVLRLGQDAASPASVATASAIVDATPTITFDPNDSQAIIIGVWEWEADAVSGDTQVTITDAVGVTDTVIAVEGISIASVTPSEFDMDAPDIDIVGTVFEATQNTGSVYLSDATTLAGSSLEVNLTTVIGTWADTSIINIDLSSLSASLLTDLQTLGPGARFIIVQNDSGFENFFAVTLHRPHGFSMVGSGDINDAGENTTAILAAPAGKDTGDFGGGRAVDIENPDNTTVDLAADEYREDLWNMEAVPLSRTVAYQFRVVIGGTEIDTYTLDPRVTVSAGTAHAETVADPVGVTDAVARVVTSARTPTEAVGVTDAALRVIDAVRAVTDPVGVTDQVAAAKAIVVEIVEAVGVIDAVVGLKAIAQVVTDPVGVTDVVSRVAPAVRVINELVAVQDQVQDDENNRETLVETVGITDTVLAVRGSFRTITEAVDLTDQTLAAKTIQVTITEDVGVTDATARSVVATRTATESVGVTDQTAPVKTIAAVITDPVGVTDTTAATLTIAVVITEAVGVTDETSRVATAVRTITESVAIQDQVQDDETNREQPVEAVGITDSILRVHDAKRSQVESVGITDAVTQIKTATVTVNDAVGVTDDTQTVKTIRVTITDAVGVTDVVDRVATAVRLITDPVGVTDQAVGSASSAGQETVTDAVGVTDSVSRVHDATRVLTEAVGVTDVVLAARSIVVVITDPVGVTDQTSRIASAVRVLTELVGVQDQVQLSGTNSEQLVEVVGITDVVSRVHDAKRSSTDSVGVTDDVQTAKTITRTITETVGVADVVTDDLTVANDFTETVTDSVGVVDFVQASRVIRRTINEDVGVTDDTSTARTIAREIVDLTGVTDSTNRVIDYFRVSVEMVGVQDVVAGNETKFITITETIGITDNAAGVLSAASFPVASNVINVSAEHESLLISGEHERLLISAENESLLVSKQTGVQ